MDSYLFWQINGLAGKSACFDSLAIFCAEYLGYVLAVVVVLLFCLPAGRQGRKWQAVFLAFLAAALARFGIVELIRVFWERPRPFAGNSVNLLLDHEETSSFPSGHAAFFFALSFVVYRYNKKAGIIFFIASSLMVVSRVFAGVHWPSDILAGALVGIFSGWIVLKFFRKFAILLN